MQTYDLIVTGDPLPRGPGCEVVLWGDCSPPETIVMDWHTATLYVRRDRYSEEQIDRLAELITQTIAKGTSLRSKHARLTQLRRRFVQGLSPGAR